MSQSIHLGYVVGTGEPVEIPLRHTAVTGQTQESGKTTTLEGLISRSGLQAVAYVTKRGESSFHVMHPIPPYFQERADWEFVQSLIEASTNTKQDFKQSWIMRASEGARTLKDVQDNINRFLCGVKDESYTPRKPKRGSTKEPPKERWLEKPARGLTADVYYVLSKYLDGIMPQLAEMPYTTTLELAAGLNVMDLRDYEFPLQALVIRSATDRIRQHLEGTINIIPEAWKFAPKFRGSPVRLAAEEFVREAAAMKNFLWIDSQDLAGVADVLMRQVGVWIFGVQRATREIWRQLEHMPEGLPAKRPRPADIATLSKGQFYVCFGKEMHKVYVQPAWMTAAHAEAIARGEEDVESARDILREYADEHKEKARAQATQKPRLRDEATPRDAGNTSVVRDVNGPSQHDAAAGKTITHAEAACEALGCSEEQIEKSSPREMRDTDHDGKAARTTNDAGTASQPQQPESRRASTPARDAAAVAENSDPEEAMWKEKYEALKADFDTLTLRYDDLDAQLRAWTGRPPDPKHGHGANGNPEVWALGDMDALLAALLRNARKDPAILQLLSQQPEIRVNMKRHTLEMSDDSTDGRIALLISQKFFDTPQDSGTLTKEFKRRGWFEAKTSNAAVLKPLAKITEMGFLVREGTMYQAVPEMKINVVEA